MTGARAVNLFKQLVEERYIYVNFLDTNISGHPWMRAAPQSLSTEGLLEIGQLPDPDERLASALLASRQVIEREPNIPEHEKQDMLDTVTKASTLATNVSGFAQAIIQRLSQTGAGKE